jgi:hypothetical protein
MRALVVRRLAIVGHDLAFRLAREQFVLLHDRLQHGNNVGGFGHRCRALLDQAVGSLGARIERRTGHCEDLASLVDRTARGDQRAGTLGGLDDDDAER